MSIAVTSVLVWLAAIDLPIGTELQYAGTLSQRTSSEQLEAKSFTLNTIALASEDGHQQLAFHLEERGGGGWGWTERFGLIPLPGHALTKAEGVRVLQTHEDRQYPLRIRSPYFEFRDKLTPQASWNDGRHDFTVTRQRKIQDRNCLQVDVSSNLGKIQTLAVETETGIVVSLEEKFILGRGDEFQLKMELLSQTPLGEAELLKHRQILAQLLAIQSSLNRTGDQKTVELNSEQLSLIRMELPRLEQSAEGTSWPRFVAAIRRDLQQQQKRLDGLDGLQRRLVGQPAPDWDLKTTAGTSISDEDVQGKVVVMHFWQYRGEPLIEPYGQIGYLDFLNNKRKKLGVVVIGVNVDERFANPKQTPVAARSMKSLLDFMKVSYDMTLDDGSVLAKFGDPRSTGAPLPLWIVIGHDGKVTHHHTGFYDIKPDEGLKSLDDAVVEAIRRKGN